jgi:hypothetical protein
MALDSYWPTKVTVTPSASRNYLLSDFTFGTLFLAVAIIVFFWPLFGGPEDVPGDIGDARLNIYLLEHFYRWAIGAHDALLSPPMFFPYPYTLGFSDTYAGSSWVYAVFRGIGLDEFGAFKSWFTVGYVATFAASYYVLLRLSFPRLLAAVGAFAFTFSLPSIAQMGHAQLLYRPAVPFCFLYAILLCEERRASHIIKLVTALSVQFLFSIYLGVFALLYTSALFPALLALSTGCKPGSVKAFLRSIGAQLGDRRTWHLSTLAPAILTLGAASAVLGFHLFVAKTYGLGRSWEEIYSMMPRVQSYLMQDGLPYWAPLSQALPEVPARQEHQIFLGLLWSLATLVGLTITAVGLLRGRVEPIRLMAAASLSVLLVCLLVLAVGPMSPYRLIAATPGLGAVRSVSRHVLVGAFPVILIGLGLMSLVARRWYWLALAMASVTMVWHAYDVWAMHKFAFSSEQARARISAASRVAAMRYRNRSNPQVLAYDGSKSDQFWARQIDAIVLADRLNIPTLNGYSGNDVPGYDLNISCDGFMRQLAAYNDWATEHGARNLGEVWRDPLIVGMPGCILDRTTIEGLHVTTGPALALASAAQVSLSVAAVTIEDNAAVLWIRIKNATADPLHGLSQNAFRLSWRVLIENQTAEPDWDPRVSLPADVPPNGWLDVPVTIPLPDKSTGATVEVSFVVEGLYWAHLVGVPPIRAKIPPR